MTDLNEIPVGKDPQEPEEFLDEHDPETHDALLHDNEGDHTLDCGCKMTRSYHDHGVFLIRCPTHREAKAVQEALNSLLCSLNRDKDGNGSCFICQEDEQAVEAAWEALDKAGGPP